MNDVNAVLISMNLLLAAAGILVWMEPRAQDRIALVLRARAAGLRAGRAAYKKAHGAVMGSGARLAVVDGPVVHNRPTA